MGFFLWCLYFHYHWLEISRHSRYWYPGVGIAMYHHGNLGVPPPAPPTPRLPRKSGRIRWSSFGPWWLIKGTMSNRWRRFWDSEILEVSFQVVFCKDLTMVTLLKMNMEEACGSFSSRMTAWQPYHMKRNSCWLQLCWNRTRTQPTNGIFCELTCSKQIWNISELIYR